MKCGNLYARLRFNKSWRLYTAMWNFNNKLKHDLKSGKTCYGSFVTSPCPEVVEVLAIAGLDFVIIDTEHTA